MNGVQTAAGHLADVLERENAALLRMDLPTAIGLLEAKRAALLAFQLLAGGKPVPDNTDEAMRALAWRLHDMAIENKRLLERAMAAQQHILSLLAQAARQAGSSTRYGALGAYVGGGASAFALSARA